MREISLTRGRVAIVDDDDYEGLAAHNWYASYDARRDRWHAQRFVGGRADRRCIKMHRAILGAAAGVFVDHVDGDGLNNQRSNLRPCSDRDNKRNSRSRRGSSSQYKGVVHVQRSYSLRRPWHAEIGVGDRVVRLGYFASEEEAALAYDDAARVHFREFARLNFPDRRCERCGCTDADCSQCIEKTGEPCTWVKKDLCSACEDDA